MILLQAISVIFGLFMLYVVRIHKRKQHIESFEYGVWIAVWVIFIFLTLFPQTVQGITERLSITRVFDLLVVVSLMILVYLTFLNRISYKRLEKKLENIIRKNAIDETSHPSKH